MIGYAEASTNPQSTFGQWLRRRWFFISLKGLLLFVLSVIGGTAGSLNFDFTPALPYEGTIQIFTRGKQPDEAARSYLQRCHDLLTPESMEKILQAAPGLSGDPLPAAFLRDHVTVSRVKSDNSFSILIADKSSGSCYTHCYDYCTAVRHRIALENWPIEVKEGPETTSKLAESAPALDTFAGVGIGLIVGVVIIWISTVRFRNEPLKTGALITPPDLE